MRMYGDGWNDDQIVFAILQGLHVPSVRVMFFPTIEGKEAAYAQEQRVKAMLEGIVL